MGRHLIWDWNGTLLDDITLVVAASNEAFASVGGPVVEIEAHRRGFRRPIKDYYSDVLGRLVDDEEFARLDKIFHDSYRVALPDCELREGVVDALTGWQGGQSLLSMWFHEELVPCVDGYGLTEFFAAVNGLRADVGGAGKAASLAQHLGQLGLSGQDVVLVGDSLDDAEAAASLGAPAVLVTGGFTDAERLRAHGAPCADSILEAVAIAARF
ncbi:HAD family hydrolase [Longispora albida]|uniref:HAD family hydrolase n=1 Tax=Longispora albida TaxID=203523 RepID=UPI0003677686|nr:HAD family hydrolase [Longispora albida]